MTANAAQKNDDYADRPRSTKTSRTAKPITAKALCAPPNGTFVALRKKLGIQETMTCSALLSGRANIEQSVLKTPRKIAQPMKKRS